MARTADIPAYQSPLELGTLPAEVRAECEQARMDGQPFTRIRPLQEGVDDPRGLSCDGATGDRTGECSAKVEAVQYNVQGEAQHYCEPHALMQNEWDAIHYRSQPKERPPLTPDEEARIAKSLEKKKGRGKKREDEPEERDLMA